MSQIDGEKVRYWLGYRPVDLQVITQAIAKLPDATTATVLSILSDLDRLNADIKSGRIDSKSEDRAQELGYRLVSNLSTATCLPIYSDVFGNSPGQPTTVYTSRKRIRG